MRKSRIRYVGMLFVVGIARLVGVCSVYRLGESGGGAEMALPALQEVYENAGVTRHQLEVQVVSTHQLAGRFVNHLQKLGRAELAICTVVRQSW